MVNEDIPILGVYFIDIQPSSFPVMHKVGNVVIFVMLKFGNWQI